jgi:hypothetical protein
MLEAVAGLLVATVTPQQTCQLFPRVRRARRQSENREQGSVLLTRQINELTARQPHFQAPEKRQLRDSHGYSASP